jgi:hypothetical protein
MNYDQYLFSQLLILYNPDFAVMEYDFQYPEALLMYEDFERSSFNDNKTGLYSCIINYLENKYPKP